MAATSLKERAPESSVGRFLIPDLPAAEDVVPYLRRIDSERWYSNFGPLVREFEGAMRILLTEVDSTPQYGPIHVTSLASGHHALEVALHLIGITQGKKVLIPAVTFSACPLAVQRVGGTVILSDVDPTAWTLTPEIARAVASRTHIDAVMPVALYGVPIPVTPWDMFSRETGIPVVIDAAAAVEVQQIPQTGLVAHSLHATKPFGIGEGGVLAGRNADLIEKGRCYSNFGSSERVCHMAGCNAKMSEYHAAVGLAQSNRWTSIKHKRGELLQVYLRHLTPLIGHVSLQPGIETAVVSLFVLMLKRPVADVILRRLTSRGVATHRSYLPPLYRHPHFATLAVSGVEGEILEPEAPVVRKQDQMVYSERMLAHLVGVPFHSLLSEDDVVSIVNEVSMQLQEC